MAYRGYGIAIATFPVVLAAALLAQVWAAGPAIPFPEALEGAAISQSRIDSVTERALILGNGDINALVYSDAGNLLLRLTKNDVWDARLDTANDLPIPTIARIKELAFGDWPDRNWVRPEGVTWSGPDSYHAHPYPCPRACAIVRLGSRALRPSWRRIRAEGTHNNWRPHKNAAVMSVRGRQGASNGYAYGPMDFSTEDYSILRVKLSGSENARFFIDVMGRDNGVVFASKWIESPTEAEERIFNLPPGKEVGRLVLYTWTEDGKNAENRFEVVRFEGKAGTLPVDLSLITPPSCSSRLDIRRAVAHVAGASDGPPKADIRALAHRNVFLIESPAPVQLLAITSEEIPTAHQGVRDGVTWLRQVIPGDADWPGMSFAVAAAANGEHKAVAIVTSRESNDVVADASALASSTVKSDISELVRQHETGWQRFWSASGIDIDDALLCSEWYRNLYFLRCVTKPGVISPGLFAGLVDELPAWHGDYHTNYNIQQTFWGSYITNHPDLTEPYDRLITEYLPRARWLARKVFDSGGAYFPHVLFAYEPANPERCRSRNGRQYIHHVWGYTIGVSGFTVQPLWWHYKYRPSRAYLEKVAYPAVRDVAVFYADFIDQCQIDDKGKIVLAPSVSPEHWGWTPKLERNRNCTFDIAIVKYTLKAAIEGATTLGRDAMLIRRFRKALERLPDYPTTKDDNPIVVDVEGAPPITYNIAVPATPVFPCDTVTYWSDAEEKELFTRTIEKLRWNGNNSTIILGVGRARLSMPGTLEWLRQEVIARLRPNGSLTLNRHGHGFNSYGHYTEQFAVSMAVSELLLQSVDDVIRVFPAWPKGKTAHFHNLRAQGGFLVSANRVADEVEQIAVAATAGGRLRLLSPWPSISVLRDEAAAAIALRPDSRGVAELDTRPGEHLLFRHLKCAGLKK